MRRRIALPLIGLFAIVVFSITTAQTISGTTIYLPMIAMPQTDTQQAPTVVFSPSAITLLRGGSVQTVSLLVTNTGTTTDSFNISFTPIAGVNVSPASTTLTNIAPNATGQVQVQISASTTAIVGPTTLGANVISQSNPSNVGSAQLAVTIADATPTPTAAPVSLQISLREGERIRTATPGNTVTYRLRVVNNGGSATTFNLAFDSTIRCSNDFSGCLQSFSGNTQNITLNPNSGFDFDVDITLPTDSSIVGNTSNTRVIATVGGVESAGLTLQINVVQATATPSPTVMPISMQITPREGDRVRAAAPGSVVIYRLRIVNNDSEPAIFTLALDPLIRCSIDLNGCVQSLDAPSRPIYLTSQAVYEFDVYITLPPDPTTIGRVTTTRIVAQGDGIERADLALQVYVVSATTLAAQTPVPAIPE